MHFKTINDGRIELSAMLLVLAYLMVPLDSYR